MIYNKKFIAVIGGGECSPQQAVLAEEVGREIARHGAVLVCGGLGGVMEAACRGCKEAGGLTLGITPGREKDEANGFVDIAIPTGMGYSRNALVAGAADIVVALPGEYGTLSEIGFALNAKKPVYGFDTWDIKGVRKLKSYEELRDVLRKAKGD